MNILKLAVSIIVALFTPLLSAGDLDDAPPSFGYKGQTAVPIDMKTVWVEYDFDVQNRRTRARATVTFVTEESGFPFFDIVPRVSKLTLDGRPLLASQLVTTRDPNSTTYFKVLEEKITAGGEHVLEIDYELGDNDVTYGSDYSRAGFFMSDLATGGREYFEQFGPANLEFDHVQYTFEVKVSGTTRDHQIYANGETVVTGPNEWRIEFPNYFTASSLYFHLGEKGRFYETNFVYSGIQKDIPVTVYSSSSSNMRSGMANTKRIMKELESDYGSFFHDRLVVYVTSSGGGMEYCGATMTSLRALGHELTHSWFARGVMPANGNAGWIDEAVASWRDNNYPRASGAPNRPSVNLGGYSVYKRETTRQAYSEGAKLISEFDYLFRKIGGMKSMLRNFFTKFAGQTIQVQNFQDFLTTESGFDLGKTFDRYVFGQRSDVEELPNFDTDESKKTSSWINLHPRPFTKAERAALR